MGRENDRHAFRNLVNRLHKNHPSLLKALHNEFVVNNRMPHIQRRTVYLQSQFYYLNGIRDSGTETSGGGENDLFHSFVRVGLGSCGLVWA